MYHILRKIALPALGTMCALGASAEIPLEYYSSLQGLSGAELKTAIHEIIANDVDMLDYGSGSNNTWWGFYVTDRDEATNTVIDRYSNNTHEFNSRGQSVSGMNIEHSFPKSWWGGSKNNAYKDLFNLMPSESSINSSKSNYPMGKVTSVNVNNGCTKVGTGSNGYKLWEPADKWKGDFSRSYLYMATAYQNFTWSGTQAMQILEQNTYPTLQKWAYELYLQWARTDRVSDIEVKRNDNVYSIQNNRNPFVDFPNLMEYIWGDSTDIALNVRTTVKSGSFSGLVIDPSEKPVTLYTNTFLGDKGNCTVEHTVRPSAISSVWQNSATYGWVGKASTGSSNYGNLKQYEADATLYTPEIDLTHYLVAYLSFDHACNYATAPSEVHSVTVTDSEGNTEILPVTKWPTGKSWSFVSSGKIPLNKYAGKKIKVGFRYTSTSAEASQWEVKNLTVTAQGRNSGIEQIPVYLQPEADNDTYPAEYYTVDGRRVDPATYRGIVIRRQGTSVCKILLK